MEFNNKMENVVEQPEFPVAPVQQESPNQDTNE